MSHRRRFQVPERPVELTPEQLRFRCNESQFNFVSTAEVAALTNLVGQERALRAVTFGVSMPNDGYNIYALGPPGSGKTYAVTSVLERRAREMPPPSDWCYVQNFNDPAKPRYLKLPAGKGMEFEKDMDQLIEALRQEISRVLESEDYDNERNRILQEILRKRNAELAQLEQKAQERRFTIQRGPAGLFVVPLADDGKMMNQEQYSQLAPEGRREIETAGEELEAELTRTMRAVQVIEKDGRRQLAELEQNVARAAIGLPMEELKDKYADNEPIKRYLADMEQDVIEHVSLFRGGEDTSQGAAQFFGMAQRQVAFDRYKVNVIVNHSDTNGAPVVIEHNPIYQNLIGRIERQAQFGALTTDFTMIKAGALHRANGGYLIVEAYHLLRHPFAYEVLKRALRTREIRITDLGQEYSLISTISLEPEPIPMEVKVVLIGNPLYYYMLQAYDEEFGELFKVQADFDSAMDCTSENTQSYAQLLKQQCDEKGLRHFAPSGVARMVEYGAELAGDQEKLSTKFADICDLASEASFYASQNGNTFVTREDVQKAIDEKIYRSNRIEQRIQEMIEKGQIYISTTGEIVGQVNGLSVMGLGSYAFGKPSRITARTYMGNSGVISIEREVRTSGPIHNKGVMTLAGYLNGRYGQDKPVAMSAQIGFEQLYEGVEGDSASSTELYALLSALSGFPIKQGLAVTGSVNQHGEIQPIGGVTEKITGFYEVCKAFGLTGDQGVLIPESNIRNLMLKEEIIAAVRDGKFHIYPVKTIDQGIEILTGKSAGERDAAGGYPEGSVNWAVEKRLRQFAEGLRAFREEKEKEREKSQDGEAPKPPEPTPPGTGV
jgi:lon-related putative ATP-dependent protease